MRLHEITEGVDRIASQNQKVVAEVEKDPYLSKEWVDGSEFNELIDDARPTRMTIKGYQIWRVSKNRVDSGATEILLVKDPEGKGFLGELRLVRSKGNNGSFVHSQVAFTTSLQGQGIAVPLYAYAIRNLGYTVASDKTQTKGSQTLWARLSKVPGIFIYGWSVKNGEYFQWDPDTDPEEEVYQDPADADRIRVELRNTQGEIAQEVQAGRMSDEEAGQQIRKAQAEAKSKLQEIDKIRWRDLRLVATATKGLGK
jgi:hypothetical protein